MLQENDRAPSKIELLKNKIDTEKKKVNSASVNFKEDDH